MGGWARSRGPARAGAAALALAAAGCVGPTPPAPVVAGPAVTRPPPMVVQGLESVIGATARALTTQFGAADLDIREGAARKLQFGSQVCVLDAYLYPRRGGEPAVTYVDARLPDGRDIDRASCVAALAARQRGR